MDKELLILYACQFAVEKLLDKGSCTYVIKTTDDNINTIEFAEVYNTLNEKIEKLEREVEK